MHFESLFKQALTRRGVLEAGAAAAIASRASLLDQVAWTPQRMALAAGSLPDIQFDIGNFIPPAFTVSNVLVRFGPVFTLFAPAKLTRNPVKADQAALANASAGTQAVEQGRSRPLGRNEPAPHRSSAGLILTPHGPAPARLRLGTAGPRRSRPPMDRPASVGGS